MMPAFPSCYSIGELEKSGAIVAIQDGNHGEKHPVSTDYVEYGIPFIMARDISDGTLDINGCKFLRKEHADSLRIGFAKHGDVLLTHKGTVGSVAIVPRVEDYVMLTPQVTYYRLEPKKLDNRYFSYALREPGFQDRLVAVSSQSTRPYVGITAQRDLQVLVHTLPMQRKIAAILSAYDDLIDNNLRRIKILEEMAQNLYREWFVKFRFPGHQHANFTDSPLGPIPEGWEVVKIKDAAEVNARSIRKEGTPAEIAYIDIASVSPGIVDKMEIMAFSDAPSRARRITRHGDIIWSSVRPNRRSFSLIIDPPANLIVSTGFAVISAKKVPFTYLYQAVTTDEFVVYLVNHAKGAAYPAVNADDFENADILVPSKQLLSNFDDKVLPIAIFTHRLKARNTTLRRTRDLLLPRLITGEVDVSELDIAVPEEATV
jgi:type I restriction enzyme, S subunit